MASSLVEPRPRIVVDSIHGDIPLNDIEWRVVDTASFQRLRFIKQLGMGHLVYPNATHARFAHSIGVLGIMQRILDIAKRNSVEGVAEQEKELRLAALLHDVGHYPYSHLLEGVDKVQLTEEFVRSDVPTKTLRTRKPYPNHVVLGQMILLHQPDLLKAIGNEETARRIGAIFGRTDAADPQWSKLINSSLDMDRLDYLLRDAQAAGVPYGSIDINYLLNSLRISPNGLIGVEEKATAAAEQFLFARYFMHRAVYWHKTTYAFEEAARQLIRRIRDDEAAKYELPIDGPAVEELVKGRRLRSFTDSYLDRLIEQAALESGLEPIKVIAQSILDRRPAKLLHESFRLDSTAKQRGNGTAFKKECKFKLTSLARDLHLPLWRFMFCETSPLKLEKRGPDIRASQAAEQPDEQADELIRVFRRGETEPEPLVDLDHSLIGACSGASMQMFRLYLIDDGNELDWEVIRERVREWDNPTS